MPSWIWQIEGRSNAVHMVVPVLFVSVKELLVGDKNPFKCLFFERLIHCYRLISEAKMGAAIAALEDSLIIPALACGPRREKAGSYEPAFLLCYVLYQQPERNFTARQSPLGRRRFLCGSLSYCVLQQCLTWSQRQL